MIKFVVNVLIVVVSSFEVFGLVVDSGIEYVVVSKAVMLVVIVLLINVVSIISFFIAVEVDVLLVLFSVVAVFVRISSTASICF